VRLAITSTSTALLLGTHDLAPAPVAYVDAAAAEDDGQTAPLSAHDRWPAGESSAEALSSEPGGGWVQAAPLASLSSALVQFMGSTSIGQSSDRS
jgi:hypothetical protein